jgi:TPR repeat protein
MSWNNRKRLVVFILFIAMGMGSYFYFDNLRYKAMHAIPVGLKRFNVTDPIPSCGRWKEYMPASRDPKAYQLYIRARKLWRSKVAWEFSREEAQGILDDVKRAADLGDWGARALLAHFYLRGLGPMASNHVLDPDEDKSVAIARMAMAAGQPWGFYDVGVAHEHGYGGAHYDLDIAWAYYLRAAELGSPEAQMALAERYGEAGRRDAQEAMRQCAYQQGHGPAAYQLAMLADVNHNSEKSLRFYQDGVKFGDELSAAFLLLVFGNETESSWREEFLGPLGLTEDIERSRRYKEIADALELDPDLKLSRLDETLPLPPAKLPEWRGVEGTLEPEKEGPPTY